MYVQTPQFQNATFSEALSHYGLDYTVRKEPLVLQNGSGNGPKMYALVRDDNDQALPGIAVKGTYKPIQHSSFADIGQQITQQLGCNFVGGGLLAGGAGVYLQADLPEPMRIRGSAEDLINKRITFINAHGGSMAWKAGAWGFRLFCKNQFWAHRAEMKNHGVSIRHTSGANDRLKQVPEVIAALIRGWAHMNDALDYMATQTVHSAESSEVVRAALGVPQAYESKELTRGQEDKINQVWHSIEQGPGQHVHRGTQYWLYQGIVHWADHVRTTRKSTNKAESMLIGTGAQVKTRAYRAIQALAA